MVRADPAPGADATTRHTHIVVHAEPPLALHQGGVSGLAPTNPEALGDLELDATSPASRAYLAHLADSTDQQRLRLTAHDAYRGGRRGQRIEVTGFAATDFATAGSVTFDNIGLYGE